MPEINPETARVISQYVNQQKAAMQAQGNAQLAESSRILDQQNAAFDRNVEWLQIVDLPARALTRNLAAPGVWNIMPAPNKEKYKEEIQKWVDKAESGDKVSQAVLLRAQSILKEKKVSTAGLPSLEWKNPDDPTT